MVLGHGHRRQSAASNRSSVTDGADATVEDETVVDEEQGSGTIGLHTESSLTRAFPIMSAIR